MPQIVYLKSPYLLLSDRRNSRSRSMCTTATLSTIMVVGLPVKPCDWFPWYNRSKEEGLLENQGIGRVSNRITGYAFA